MVNLLILLDKVIKMISVGLIFGTFGLERINLFIGLIINVNEIF